MSNLSSETEIEFLDEESSNTQEQNENVSLFEVVGYVVAPYARYVVGFFLFNSVVHG